MVLGIKIRIVVGDYSLIIFKPVVGDHSFDCFQKFKTIITSHDFGNMIIRH